MDTSRSRPTAAPPARKPRIGLPEPLSRATIDPLVLAALEEDCGRRPDGSYVFGDVTSDGAIPAERLAKAKLVAKADGVLAGLDVFARVFELCDPGVRIERLAADGQRIAPKQELLRLVGRARALLVGERTALNFIQRMSGTATLTAQYVSRTAGRARILDTRKTTPGLRVLEKYAVRCGGGENHRIGLYDEAMVKNNHLDLAGKDLALVLRELRAKLGDDFVITAEARDESEAVAAVAGGADIVLLDNLTVSRMQALCPTLRAQRAAQGPRKLEIEASGGITLANVDAVAASGVDRISIGALTHSAPALDLSLYLEPTP